MYIPNKNIWLIVFFSLFFTFLINLPDIYCIIADVNRWVPVNTPPLAIGDEYHYFSVLKMMAFGGYYGIPYDQLSGILFLEFSRIIPYILNLPIYYLGSVWFDTRYGVLFVRIFDALLLYFAMYYFIQTINRLNGWKNNIFLSITSIFLIFYGFHGLNIFFLQKNIFFALENFYTFFGYIMTENFIYNNSTINDLSRAIIASTTAPIILFMLSLRLQIKKISLILFITILLILSFTSLPFAIAFGLISIFLDIYNKIGLYIILRNMLVGLVIGSIVVLIQTKLVFGIAESAQEVISLGFNLSFRIEYFTLPLIIFLIVLIAKKNLSIPIAFVLLILSLFQPLAMVIGGEHGSRLWVRSNTIPFIILFIHLTVTFIHFGFMKYFKDYLIFKRLIIVVIISSFTSLIFLFTWKNTVYLSTQDERFVNNSQILSYILNDKESSVIVTNSTQVAMLIQLYDKVSTPLIGHFSLQSLGYKKSWEKTIVNFELLGIPAINILQNISNNAPQRYWLRKREALITNMSDFASFYFDELLFASTYATYNHQMLKDKIINDQKILQPSFYQMKLEKESTYSMIKNKKVVYIIDTTMPIIPSIESIQNRRGLVQFANYEIYDKDIN